MREVSAAVAPTNGAAHAAVDPAACGRPELREELVRAVCGAIVSLSAQDTPFEQCYVNAAAGRPDRPSSTQAGDSADPQRTQSRVTVEARRDLRHVLREVCGVTNPAVLEHLASHVVTSGQDSATATPVAQSLRKVFDDILFSEVEYKLKESGTDLRLLFKSCDAHSLGHLNRSQLSDLLAGVCRDGLPPDAVLDFLFESVTTDSKTVAYTNLFNCIFRTRPDRTAARTIRSVAVITRHGARLPLKSFPRTLRWPSSNLFWEDYGGKLTPVGMDQHHRLGARLRKKYILSEGLLEEQSPETPSRVLAFTSNMDRTIMSAQSCLLGFCPGASIAFIIDEDGVNEAQQQALSRDSIRICMSMSDYTPLLHGFKQNPAYSKLRKAAMDTGRFSEWAKSPAHVSVVEKLWRMTAFEGINPTLPMAMRLRNLQSVAQQIGIEKAHKMNVLMNPDGLKLGPEDQNIVFDVAQYICRLRYCGHDQEQQANMARLATGLLPAAIVNNFRAVVEDEDHGGHFTLYSAHDNTIMALLAHLGFRNFPLPSFAAHLVFELHEVDTVYTVRVLYNSDPDRYGFNTDVEESNTLQPCQYLDLPLSGAVDWEDRVQNDGGIKLDDFIDLIMVERGSFRTPEDWNSAAHTPSEAGSPATTTGEGPSETYDSERRNSPFSMPHGLSPGSSITLMGHHFREHISRSTALKKPKVAETPLKPFKGQVAGHPMTFMELGDSMLCKPIRATCAQELVFYQQVFGSHEIASAAPITRLIPFLPLFYGEIFVNAELRTATRLKSDGAHTNVLTRTFSLKVPQEYSLVELDTAKLEVERDETSEVLPPVKNDDDTTGQVCIVLENLLAPFASPCVLDLKIGTRQHGDDVTGKKRERAIQRCAETTSATLGVRVSGMRVWRDGCNDPLVWGKDYGKSLTQDNFEEVFELFFNTAAKSIRKELLESMVHKIEALQAVLASIDGYRFFSSSLLLIYDRDSSNNNVDVRLIDFARVRIPVPDPQDQTLLQPDTGALLGLSTILKSLTAVRNRHVP